MRAFGNARGIRAFSLVEIALALGVAAFCLVAIFGLLPIGTNSNQASIEQTAASNAAASVRLDLQAMPKGADPTAEQSALYKIPAPPSPLSSGGTTVQHAFYLQEDGAMASTVDANAVAAENPRYRVTVTYNVPTAAQAFYAVPTRILVTWPALADPTAATAPAHYTGSVEIGTALSRE